MQKTNVIFKLHQFMLVGMLACTTYCAWAQALDLTVHHAQPDTEKRMDLAFQDVPVRAFLQVLGESAGANVVVDDSVNGTVTLNLKQATWQEALDVVSRAKQLSVEQKNGIYYIRAQNPSNYAGANSAYSTANPQNAEGKSRANGTEQQVLIEARIVEAGDSFSRSLGVKLGFNDLRRTGYTTVPDPANPGKTIQIPVQAPTKTGAVFGSTIANVQNLSGQDPALSNNLINLPALASASANPASFAVSLFRSGLSEFINLEISALETDGKGKVISSPRVVTSDGVKALIEQGTELPYQQSTSSGATSVSFRKANLKLQVTPQIMNNGDVVMDVDVTKDSVGSLLTSAGYTIDTKHVQTTVKIENGGTIVIGGIYQEDVRNSEDKVPFLGDIPYLGRLFKSTTKSTSKTELLIFLTPHLLDAKGQLLSNTANYVK